MLEEYKSLEIYFFKSLSKSGNPVKKKLKRGIKKFKSLPCRR